MHGVLISSLSMETSLLECIKKLGLKGVTMFKVIIPKYANIFTVLILILRRVEKLSEKQKLTMFCTLKITLTGQCSMPGLK